MDNENIDQIEKPKKVLSEKKKLAIEKMREGRKKWMEEKAAAKAAGLPPPITKSKIAKTKKTKEVEVEVALTPNISIVVEDAPDLDEVEDEVIQFKPQPPKKKKAKKKIVNNYYEEEESEEEIENNYFIKKKKANKKQVAPPPQVEKDEDATSSEDDYEYYEAPANFQPPKIRFV